MYTVQVYTGAGAGTPYAHLQFCTVRYAVRRLRRLLRLAYQWAGCWPVGLRGVVVTPTGKVYTLYPQYKA